MKLLILILILSSPALAALTVDSSMPSGVCATGTKPTGATGCAFTATGTSLGTPSFTNTAGTLLVCAAVVTRTAGGGAASITSFTYGGASLGTADVAQSFGAGNESLVAIYHLLSPLTGANTVALTPNSSADLIVGCVSFTGNDTSLPIRANNKATGNSASPSVSIASGVTGNIVVDAVSTGSGITSSTTSGGTFMWGDNLNASTAGSNGGSTRASASGSTTMTYTVTADFWGIAAVEVAALVAVPVVPLTTTIRGTTPKALKPSGYQQ